ncbi:unnamed protein product [Mucor hiemalis]
MHGTEVGTGEVKPGQTPEKLSEIDRCRIAESCKRQLHQRLFSARSTKGLQTYGTMIRGNVIKCTALQLWDTGDYKHLRFYGSNVDEVDSVRKFFWRVCRSPIYSSFLRPTVYMIKAE